MASLARDYALPGKKNFSSFYTDSLMAYEKRNLGSFMRTYGGKRNIAALARDFALPPMPARTAGKRTLFRSWVIPYEDIDNEEKRNVAALSKNDAWPILNKRFGVGSARVLGFPYKNRVGRSLSGQGNTQVPLNLQKSDRNQEHVMMDALGLLGTKNRSIEEILAGEKRPKRQFDYSDEYPLPVMQNNNVFEYEELIEALTGQYPKTEKRFMGKLVYLLR